MLLALLLATIAASDAAPRRVEDGIAPWLAELEDERAERRAAAERWLAVHLAEADRPALTAYLGSAGAEGRRRLVQALGADDRHLALAAALAVEDSPAVAGVGSEAIAELLARWTSSADDAPSRGRELPEPWIERSGERLALDPDDGSLVDVVERFGRLARLPAPLVVDPALDPALRAGTSDRSAPGELAGEWPALLEDLVRAHWATFEVVGFRAPYESGAGRAQPWIRIAPRGAEGEGTTLAHVLRWCTAVAAPGDEARRAASARALAALGWPAAVAWLERRALGGGDRGALDAILLAAAVGRAAPGLAHAETVRRLVREADRRLAQGDVTGAERIARALTATGPIGTEGEAFAPVLLEGWDVLGPAERWVRLVAIEGQGVAPPAALEAARAVLASDAPPGLRLQALRCLDRTGGDVGGPSVAHPAALFDYALGRGLVDELGRDLAEARAPLPAPGWLDALPDAPSVSLAVVEWALHMGDVEAAAPALQRLRQPAFVDLLARRLSAWAALGAGSEVRGLFERAGAGALGEERLRRLALRGDFLDAEARRAELERLVTLPAPEREDLVDLATLASDPDLGGEARDRLTAELTAGTPETVLVPGLERAFERLRAARLDEEIDAWRSQLRREAAGAGHPLEERLLGRNWPPVPASPPRRLEAEDRRLDLGG